MFKSSMSIKVKVALALLLLAVLATSIYFINDGIKYWSPQGRLRLSAEKWQEGKYLESIKWYTSAYKSAYDAGVRWFIAGFYFRQEAGYLEKGKLDEALKRCRQAQLMLGAYDDEGAVDYNCFLIEQEMKK